MICYLDRTFCYPEIATKQICAEACAEKLPAWKCKALFRPTEDALKNRIAELTREVEHLKAIKDIDELKRLLKEQIAYLAMILRNRNDNL